MFERAGILVLFLFFFQGGLYEVAGQSQSNCPDFLCSEVDANASVFAYDVNGDSVISTSEILDAVADWLNNKISEELMCKVRSAWLNQCTFQGVLLVPDFNFFPLQPKTGDVVMFDAGGSTPQDQISLYAWDFEGDSVQDAIGRTATHKYLQAGTYKVILAITSGQGITVKKTSLVTVVQAGVETCSDGTGYNACSSVKPLYCDKGALVSNCFLCGCPQDKPVCSVGVCTTGTVDINGPILSSPFIAPDFPTSPGSLISIQVHVVSDTSGVGFVKAVITGQSASASVYLFDDGKHNDGDKNDGVFGGVWDSTGFAVGFYEVKVVAADGLGNTSELVFDKKITLSGSLNQGCMELIPGVNDVNANRLNLVFVGGNYDSVEQLRKLALSIVDWGGTGQGLFSLKPFNEQKNKNRFNFWYINKILAVTVIGGVKHFKYRDNPLIPANTYELRDRFDSLAHNCNVSNTFKYFIINDYFRSNSQRGPYGSIQLSDNSIDNVVQVAVHESGHLIGELFDEYVEPGSELEASRSSLQRANIYESDHDISMDDCLANTQWKDQIGNGCGEPGKVDCIDNYIISITNLYVLPGNQRIKLAPPKNPVYTCDYGKDCNVPVGNSFCNPFKETCFRDSVCPDDAPQGVQCQQVAQPILIKCVGTPNLMVGDCYEEVSCFEGSYYVGFNAFRPTFNTIMRKGGPYKDVFGAVDEKLIQQQLDFYTGVES